MLDTTSGALRPAIVRYDGEKKGREEEPHLGCVAHQEARRVLWIRRGAGQGHSRGRRSGQVQSTEEQRGRRDLVGKLDMPRLEYTHATARAATVSLGLARFAQGNIGTPALPSVGRANPDPGVADLVVVHGRVVGLDAQAQHLR
jgi:hypothetical protein